MPEKNILTKKQFLQVIAHTPLVAFDLVVRDEQNRILMGRRVNEPAIGTWFVPGGRIHKDEGHEAAFERICEAELGEKLTLSEASFLGVFTHKYPTNYYHVQGITTHYVVLAYELKIQKPFALLPDRQHSEYRWFSSGEPEVHPNVLPYFNSEPEMSETQYNVLNARRDSHNNLLWQTPVLSLTAQAFLFSIILSASTPNTHRITAIILALITSVASLHLLDKHRFMEIWHTKMLQDYENRLNLFKANGPAQPKTWYTGLSSYKVWRVLLFVFFIAALWNFPDRNWIITDQVHFSINFWIRITSGIFFAYLFHQTRYKEE